MFMSHPRVVFKALPRRSGAHARATRARLAKLPFPEAGHLPGVGGLVLAAFAEGDLRGVEVPFGVNRDGVEPVEELRGLPRHRATDLGHQLACHPHPPQAAHPTLLSR